MVLDALTGYEFKSILVGVKLPSEVCEKEDEVRSVVALPYGESLREELSRVLGKKLSSILKVKVDMRKPDVTVVVDPYRMMVEVNPAPIYVKGFFLKLSPEVPVVSKDLERVGGETVETLIVRPLMKAFEAVDYRFIIPFRDSKRTLILGDGRPFVVRFKHPRKRFVDLDELASEINSRASGLMEVRRLSWASRSDVAKLRSFKGVEEAKVLVKADRDLRFTEPKRLTVMQLDKSSNVEWTHWPDGEPTGVIQLRVPDRGIPFVYYLSATSNIRLFKENEFKAKITKTILGMANIKDGGWIVIGKRKQEDETADYRETLDC